MARRNRDYRRNYDEGPEEFRSPNPNQLYLSRTDKMVGGVCGGIAERFGWDSALIRVGALIALFTTGGGAAAGYIIAMMIIPKRPSAAERARNPEEDAFWREVSDRPRATFGSIKYKFMDLEERLRRMESNVTSDEWRLRREFRDIEN